MLGEAGRALVLAEERVCGSGYRDGVRGCLLPCDDSDDDGDESSAGDDDGDGRCLRELYGSDVGFRVEGLAARGTVRSGWEWVYSKL